MGDDRYPDHLAAREQRFSEWADEMVAAFEGCEHIILNKPSGAFYFTVMFKDGVLGNDQVLDIADTGIRATIE
jgi:hypothetical protein